jgi:hypothetical protein
MNFFSSCSQSWDVGLGIITFCTVFNIMLYHHSKINMIISVGSMFLVNLGVMRMTCTEDSWQYIVKTSAFHCFVGICLAYLAVFLDEKIKLNTNKSDH